MPAPYPVNVAFKKCSKCKVEKSAEFFSKASDKCFGLQSQCKECRAAYSVPRFQELNYTLRVEAKTCNTCLTEKPSESFSRRSVSKDGLNSRCKECTHASLKGLNRPVSVASKICSRCKIVKTADLFSREGTRIDGLSSQCKKCKNTQARSHRETELTNTMFCRAKARAQRQGVPFTITRDDIVVPNKCPVLGIDMRAGREYIRHNSPTLDKVIPALGYVKGNVQVLSARANLMKSDASREELLRFANWIHKNVKPVQPIEELKEIHGR